MTELGLARGAHGKHDATALTREAPESEGNTRWVLNVVGLVTVVGVIGMVGVLGGMPMPGGGPEEQREPGPGSPRNLVVPAALAQQKRAGPFWSRFDQAQQIDLRERDGVITVTPVIRLEEDGTMLIADTREAQVRRYAPSGELLLHFGSKGEGPGEFRHLTAAFTVAGGEILAFDMDGAVSRFDAEGTFLEKTRSRLGPIFAATKLNDDTAVVVGRLDGNVDGPLVHLYDVRSGAVLESFSKVPAHRPELDGAYAFTGFADVAVRDRTIAVLHALGTHIEYYGADGRFLRAVKIPYRHFRPLTSPMPVGKGQDVFRAWASTFSTASHLVWGANGTVYVQYFDLQDSAPAWRLLAMTPDGAPEFDEVDTPKLLAAAFHGPDLLFERLKAENPGQLSRVAF